MHAGNVFAGLFGSAIIFGIIALLVVAVVAFFRGPAQHAEDNNLATQFQNPSDRALFLNMYRTKGPKSVVTARVLTLLLSPTISYVYQGKWGLAIISFVTLQGLFVWYLIALFSMPFEVMRSNKRLADEAFNQLMISRPQAAVSPQAVPGSGLAQG